jgi:hypothetical protein
MVRFRSFAAIAAQLAAVSFSLAVLAWLVVTAQRNANPQRVASPGTERPDFELILSQTRKPVFLGPTKSEPLTEFQLLTIDEFNFHGGIAPSAPDARAGSETEARERPIFLPSSKVLSPRDMTWPSLKPREVPPYCKPAAPKP